MKLELKHLAPYLPYGLQVSHTLTADTYQICGLNVYSDKILNAGSQETFPYEDIKPLLLPLSELTSYEIVSVFGAGFSKIHSVWPYANVCTDSDKEMLTLIHDSKHFYFDVINNQFSTGSWAFNQSLAFGKLHELHVDIYGLIYAGLALNKLTTKH